MSVSLAYQLSNSSMILFPLLSTQFFRACVKISVSLISMRDSKSLKPFWALIGLKFLRLSAASLSLSYTHKKPTIAKRLGHFMRIQIKVEAFWGLERFTVAFSTFSFESLTLLLFQWKSSYLQLTSVSRKLL